MEENNTMISRPIKESFTNYNNKIDIIIPYYNEQKNIPILIEEINIVMRQTGKEYEVVLVDDGSELKVESQNSKSEPALYLFMSLIHPASSS